MEGSRKTPTSFNSFGSGLLSSGKKCAYEPHNVSVHSGAALLQWQWEVRGTKQQQNTQQIRLFLSGLVVCHTCGHMLCCVGALSSSSHSPTWRVAYSGDVMVVNPPLFWTTKEGRMNIPCNYPTIWITCPIFRFAISCLSCFGICQTDLWTIFSAGKQKTTWKTWRKNES